MEDNRSLYYAETLSKMIKLETISEWGQTDLQKFYDFHQLLKELFPKLFSVLSLEVFDGSILACWKGKASEELPVLFMSHHDVVEATGQWHYLPFSGEIAEGKLWGRGTLDTKGNLFAMLQGAEELVSEGFVPNRDIYFLSTCNEETDGSGADFITNELIKRNIRFEFVLDEGGMIANNPIDGVNGSFALIGVGEKGTTDLKFIAHSNGGHASTPGKNTPLVRLGKFMAEAEKMKFFKSQMPDAISEMFKRMSPAMTGYMKLIFSNLWLFKGLVTKLLPSISSMAGAMVKSTVAFTMAKGSDGTNVMPQEAWVIANLRSSHHQGRDDSIDQLKNLAKKYDLETEILDLGVASPISDYKSDAFKLVEKAIYNVFTDVVPTPYIMTGASDSRFLSRVCDNCLRFAPFSITNEQLDSIHGLNENVNVDSLSFAVDFFKYIMGEV